VATINVWRSSDSDALVARLRSFSLEDARAWLDSGQPDDAFDDWLTDRVARRPSGSLAREVYCADEVHDLARLIPGGRLGVYTTAPELRGSPAAPEPIASRVHFYTDDELAELARRAGLRDVAVRNDSGGQLLTAPR
jgi:hypothetical protein